jgi:NTE family protein
MPNGSIRPTTLNAASPVQLNSDDEDQNILDEGSALCLSGGGYRAMLFHVGAIWRLYESGILKEIKRVSSVSGGSITAGVLALKWRKLFQQPAPSRELLVREFVTPLRELSGRTIDRGAVVFGVFLPGNAGDRVASAYDKYLFHGATLQDLPDSPRFVINATNVQSGALWRFMKPYMADYRVGVFDAPQISLSQAVAASSAFPPFLSPVEIRPDRKSLRPGSGTDLGFDPYTAKAILSDGGVYDNLGLETAWKRFRTILVSDGGGKLDAESAPSGDWARHSYRVLNLVDNQVRSMRKRQLLDSYMSPSQDLNHRKGAYWGIRTNVADYGLGDAFDCPQEKTSVLASVPTRLKAVEDGLQERLINWGYAVCDAAIRKHVNPTIPAPPALPYSVGV